jgi:hypothetical protein
MHATRRFRPLLTVLALIALLFAPWPAQAAPISPFESFTGWLADLWAKAGFILDPDGVAGGEPVSTSTEGFILDPNGGTSLGGGGTPPAGTDNGDEGFILDPDGRPR